MTIAVKITGDEEYGRWLKVLFCGEPGSGKTLISSTFPNPIYASADEGLMSIARRQLPFVKIEETKSLMDLLNALQQEPDVRESLLGNKVDTVVIDTIDEVARLLIKERLAETKQDSFKIQDWGWLGDQMRGVIRAFRNLDMHVVFTCHLKQSEDSETGRLFFKPAIQGAVGDEISGYVDLALLLTARSRAQVVDGESKKVITRYLSTTPDPNFPWIKDRSGALPPEVEVNFEDDYERINELIFGGISPISVEKDVAPEKVAELTAEKVEPEPEPEPESEAVAEQEQPEAVAEQRQPPPGVDPVTGEKRTPVEDVRALASDAERMRVDSPYPCEECAEYFDNEDQRDLSVIKKHRILCTKCYKAAN